MTAQEQPEGLALSGQALRLGPIRQHAVFGAALKPNRSTCPTLTAREFCSPRCIGAIEFRGQRRAIRPDAIEAAGADQGLEHPPIDPLQIDAPAQIGQTLDTAPRAARSSMMASTAEAPTPLMAPMP